MVKAKSKTEDKATNNDQINIRVTPKIAEDFRVACEKMGIPHTAVLRACIISILRNKKIPFEIGFDDDFTTSDSKNITIDSNIDTDENIMSDTDSTNNAINNTSNDSKNTTSDSNSNKNNSKDSKFFDDMWNIK